MQYCAYCGQAVEAVSYTPCPRCENPSNGSPHPAAGGKNTSTALVVVLVIAGGLVVIAIIGILAAIAIPNLLTATQKAKQKRTMADIRSLGVALESYNADNNEYPKGAAPVDLRDALVPKYIRAVPGVDGWGFGLQYTCLKDATTPGSDKCVGYIIGSPGKDGHFEHDSLLEVLAGPEKTTTNFDCDIVYSGGKFVEYPEGAQH
ncbi:MAG TPA: type II secretion system protein GspG [Thermoanaerobaculia bacterium]|jgi:type II secretory pathway pseudopilin PulG|nr:type II secretion system protein GspG [Thermoanaerobaculia bacterium]